jgi:hypothetical protein
VANFVVNDRPNLPRDEFDRLKAQLHRCATLGAASQNREAFLNGRPACGASRSPYTKCLYLVYVCDREILCIEVTEKLVTRSIRRSC